MPETPAQTLERFFEQIFGENPRGHYFTRSSEPDGWDTSGKAIPVDVAVTAVRIFAFKAAVKIYPAITRQKAEATRATLSSFSSLLLRAAWKDLVNVIFKILSLWNAVKGQMELEQIIRAQALITQRQLLGCALEKSHGKRRKIVSTRNPNGRR